MIKQQMDGSRPAGISLLGECFGGLASVLVALPSAIAYGLVIYASLGTDFYGIAVIAGICGTIIIGFVAALLGGTPGLISAPCAPAAAVLSVFALELVRDKGVPLPLIPQYLAIVGLSAGLMQFLIGSLGGGKIIKYIPYPVIAGYLSGVGLLIVLGQMPKFFGYPKDVGLLSGILNPSLWSWESLIIGCVTIAVMLLSPLVIREIPAAIIALVSGIGTYFLLSLFVPGLLVLEHNKLVIGPIAASAMDIGKALMRHWTSFAQIDPVVLVKLAVPAGTLAILLSIDTLKTCVILDALTGNRHDSNKELVAQGCANLSSAIFCGMPGAGTMGATLVNITSGGRTRLSGILGSFFGLVILLLIGHLIAWIPLASLAGILFVVGARMVDFKSVYLLKHRSTMIDFLVILAVILSALFFSLLVASAVGIAMAIILFLREQIQTPVIRRKLNGAQVFSMKRRSEEELLLLEREGRKTTICELHGQLFFGTADQLYTELAEDVKVQDYVIIDMRRVRTVDYTAVNVLKQIHAKLKAHGGVLIVSSVPRSLPSGTDARRYLRYLGLQEESESLKFFANLDSALEWVEESVLRRNGVRREDEALELAQIPFFRGMPQEMIWTLEKIMDVRDFKAGERLFSQNDPGDEMLFIRKGTVKVSMPLEGGERQYLATLQKGEILGEMAFLDKGTRSADAIAETNGSLFSLKRDKFNDLTSEHPEISSVLFKRLARELSQRLRRTHLELKAAEE